MSEVCVCVCVSDVTEDLGQFIAMKVVCCIIGEKKKHNLCLQTRPVICGVKVTDRKLRVQGQTERTARRTHWIYSWTRIWRTLLTQLRRVQPVTLLISLQLQFWHCPFSYTFCMATYRLFYSGNKLFFRKLILMWVFFFFCILLSGLRPAFSPFMFGSVLFCHKQPTHNQRVQIFTTEKRWNNLNPTRHMDMQKQKI